MKKIIFTAVMFFFILNNADSQTWIQRLPGISMWSVCRDLPGNIYAGTSGTVRAIYKSTDGGNNFNPILQNGVTNFLSIAVDSQNNIYSANVSNGLVKSTDGGNNWITIPVSVFNGKSLEVVACGKNGYIYVGTISGGLFRSTDYGNTFPDTAITSGTFVTIVIDKYNSNIIYAGASSTTGITGLFRSTDAGLTYTATSNTNTCWGVVQKGPLELYMATTSTGYPFTKSTDGGLNWTTVGTQPGAMRGMTLDLAGNIYICGNGGVFKSTNNGATFTNANYTNSGNQIIGYQNKIFAAISGTTYGGVWYFVDSSLSNIQKISTGIPEQFMLYQNYPNPFNAETKIKFDLKEDGRRKTEDVKLVIYDVTGREIETLVNEQLQPGTYEITFDGSNFASGIYFYQFRAGYFIQTKKLILLK